MYDLVGVDGNAWSVMAYVINAMRDCGFDKEEQEAYQKSAMSGDYNNLLCESIEMIDRCNKVVGDDDMEFDDSDGEIDLEE